MKRSEIRTFLQSGVEAINPVMPFGSGRLTEWNSNRSNEYPGVWWESDKAEVGVEIINQTLPDDGWPIILYIAKLGKMDDVPKQYEQHVDDCDYIAQQLIKKYNAVVTDSDTITLTGISRVPWIKKNADGLTGVILSFTLNAPDKTNLC